MGLYSHVGAVMRYRITVSYDGSGFCGWQSQRNGASVQDAIETATERLTGVRAHVTGSGRTDAGVHALAQVAHFDSEKVMEPRTVIGGLNAHLPRAIRVIDAEVADETFDARKCVKKKTYMYLMYRGVALPVLTDRAVCIASPDVEAMRRAAAAVVGTHDFSTFMASGSGAKTTTRTVFDAHIVDDEFFVKLFVSANGFLYNMVRIIAAQIIRAGRGEPVDIPALIAAKDRTKAKDTAPACGLYLYRVEY